jgi:hypothetical protein
MLKALSGYVLMSAMPVPKNVKNTAIWNTAKGVQRHAELAQKSAGQVV